MTPRLSEFGVRRNLVALPGILAAALLAESTALPPAALSRGAAGAPRVHAGGWPGCPGNRKSMNAAAVGCGSWLARPGRSLASINAYSSPVMSGTSRSMPVTGIPIASAADTATRHSSSCTRAVTSWMVAPWCRLAVRRTRSRTPSGSTSSSAHPLRAPSPRSDRRAGCGIRRRWPRSADGSRRRSDPARCARRCQ